MEILLECYSVIDTKRRISLEQKVYDEVSKDQTQLYILDLTQLKANER
jgi:hypothetical protein